MLARQAGLTLVELMVVVAVMAVLASIAYPLYTNQVQKTRRADAKIALQNVALAQERFYTINGRYTANLSSLQVSAAIRDDSTSDEGYYDIALSVTGSDNEQFTVTASKKGAQASDNDCAEFVIDQLGVKTATDHTDAANTKCW